MVRVHLEPAHRQTALDAVQPRGIRAALPSWKPGDGQEFSFSLKLALRGTERFAVVPMADDSRIEMSSARPPSFGGRFLPDPDTQHTGADGFRTTWRISARAADAAQMLRAAEARNCQPACGPALDALEVRLIEPVAIYTLSDRALKYAYLFSALTFAAFFVFEALKRLVIHPIQYLFVGLALSIFFLLPISLSEHVAFGLAYAPAATACCVLGSLLLFGLLAAAMISTRKVDWYALGAPVPPRNAT